MRLAGLQLLERNRGKVVLRTCVMELGGIDRSCVMWFCALRQMTALTALTERARTYDREWRHVSKYRDNIRNKWPLESCIFLCMYICRSSVSARRAHLGRKQLCSLKMSPIIRRVIVKRSVSGGRNAIGVPRAASELELDPFWKK